MYKTTHQGLSHVKRNIPNQDSVVCETIKVGMNASIYVLAVADGVSACKNAEIASSFLTQNLLAQIENNKYSLIQNEHMCESVFKRCIDSLYIDYLQMINESEDQLYEFGSTLEVVVIYKHCAFTFHAGDGLIVLIHENGNITISNAEKHSGEFASQVYPFFEKKRWEFNRYDKVVGALVASDGVYDEIVPLPSRSMNTEYDVTLLMPCMDIRCHKNMKSMTRFIESYIIGNLNDMAVLESFKRLIKKGIVSDISNEELYKHFSISTPYKKFVSSKDDLSLVIWGDKKRIPSNYDCVNHLPDYYSLWIKQRECDMERAQKIQGIYNKDYRVDSFIDKSIVKASNKHEGGFNIII